jgi:hypothetical protein
VPHIPKRDDSLCLPQPSTLQILLCALPAHALLQNLLRGRSVVLPQMGHGVRGSFSLLRHARLTPQDMEHARSGPLFGKNALPQTSQVFSAPRAGLRASHHCW